MIPTGSSVKQYGAEQWEQERALNLGRGFWFALGWAALALGAIGVVLPVLPTTPLVILAAFAFGKSSPRLEAWLKNSRTFGPIIANWRANGSIAPRHKAISIVMMGAVLLLSLVMGVAPVVLLIQAVCIAAASAFILSRPSRPR